MITPPFTRNVVLFLLCALLAACGAPQPVAEKKPAGFDYNSRDRDAISRYVARLVAGNTLDKPGDDAFRMPPLCWAALYDNDMLVQVLLAKNADPNLGDKTGMVPLSFTFLDAIPVAFVQTPESIKTRRNTAKTKVNIIQQLIDAGANPDKANKNRYTPLMAAVDSRMVPEDKVTAIKLLLQRGADPDLQDDTGYSALMIAVEGNMPATVDALLNAGADTGLQNKQGETALDIAKRKNHANLFPLFPDREEGKAGVAE